MSPTNGSNDPSNMHEIVRQYQKVFDILWQKAIPVNERIREIEASERGRGKAEVLQMKKNTRHQIVL